MPDARSERRAGIRRAVLNLFLSVIALDAVAIGAYYAIGVQQKPKQLQLYFIVVWTVLTAGVVATMLRKVRRARYLR